MQPLLALVNGTIHTMNPAQPKAEAVVLDPDTGTIVRVGSSAEIQRLAGPLARLVDLRGHTVLPGFIDAHMHLLHYNHQLHAVNLLGTRSEQEAAARVQARVALSPKG